MCIRDRPYYEGMPVPETYKFNGQEFKINVKGTEEIPDVYKRQPYPFSVPGLFMEVESYIQLVACRQSVVIS